MFDETVKHYTIIRSIAGVYWVHNVQRSIATQHSSIAGQRVDALAELVALKHHYVKVDPPAR